MRTSGVLDRIIFLSLHIIRLKLELITTQIKLNLYLAILSLDVRPKSLR